MIRASIPAACLATAAIASTAHAQPAPTSTAPPAAADASPATPEADPIPAPGPAPPPPAYPPPPTAPSPAPGYVTPTYGYAVPPAPARARAGFTFELSLGVGITGGSVDDLELEPTVSLSGLNLGLGGWVSPDTALTLRIAGTTFLDEEDPEGPSFSAAFGGVAVQHFVSDAAFLGAGVGVGAWSTPYQVETEGGLGLDLRGGVNLVQGRSVAMYLAAEVTPVLVGSGTIVGAGVQLGLQVF